MMLALARKHGGVFVTFDHAVPVSAVIGASAAQLVLI